MKKPRKVSIPNDIQWMPDNGGVHSIRLILIAAHAAHGGHQSFEMTQQELINQLGISTRYRSEAHLRCLFECAARAAAIKHVRPDGGWTLVWPFSAVSFRGRGLPIQFMLSPVFQQRIQSLTRDFTMADYQIALGLTSVKATLLYLILCRLEHMHYRVLTFTELAHALAFNQPDPRLITQCIKFSSRIVETRARMFCTWSVVREGRNAVAISFDRIERAAVTR